MKFARVLQDSQIPEWRKAYIDYRGLKKQITAIELDQELHQLAIIKSVDEDHRPRSRSQTPPRLTFEEPPEAIQRKHNRPFSVKSDSLVPPEAVRSSVLGRGGLNRLSLRGFLPSFKHPQSRATSIVGSGSERRAQILEGLPLHEILALLTPQEATFFTMLDVELQKVESFYSAREEEMIGRGRLLQMQLNELNDHRNLVLKAHGTLPWGSSLKSAIISTISSNRTVSPDSVSSIQSSDATHSTLDTVFRFKPQSPVPLVAFNPTPAQPGKRRDVDEEKARGRKLELSRKESKPKRKPPGAGMLDVDMDGYLSAKRKLKKAVLEHYRGLELLHNYRVINITGFRKAVKKFEKVTKIEVQQQYMMEKVEKSTFASSEAIKEMMTEMEDKYANAFLKGDRKRATSRLRAGANALRTHHYSVFRAGAYLGLALPALVDGLVKACQDSTISEKSTLLFLFGVFLVPAVFSLLVGLNLMVWASARINYAFIFELEVLSRIDYRQYFEIPAILVSSLIYAFWLCFAQIGSPPTQLPVPIQSKLWPLLWLVFAVAFVINPLPIMHRKSRYWFVRKLGQQFLSGLRPVEFTDFWMGDQLCSMMFSLSHLPTFVCVYTYHFMSNSFPANLNVTCGTPTNMWAAEFIFSSLALVMRLAQSIKRYSDSRLHMHLVNGGKYLSSIVSTFFYLYWRRTHGYGTSFVLWCLCNTFASIYGGAWDLRMDWSLLGIRNTNHPFLRSDLIYNHTFLYYIAIVTNTLLRFSWLLYIPSQGPDMLLRSFIVAVLEMFRRWQWNFLRLENEHLGNIDQYRVTREVPLPYSFDGMDRDEDEIEDEKRFKANVQRKKNKRNK